jgi:hypothetical protein
MVQVVLAAEARRFNRVRAASTKVKTRPKDLEKQSGPAAVDGRAPTPVGGFQVGLKRL